MDSTENRKPARRIDPRVFTSADEGHSAPELTPSGTFLSENPSRDLSEIRDYLSKCMSESEALTNSMALEIDGRIEQVSLKIDMLAKRMKEVVSAQSQKMRELSMQLNQSRTSEERVTSLIEKHNQIVNTFESKLNKMQNVIDDQEIKLINTTTTLKEALHTLEKLKRL